MVTPLYGSAAFVHQSGSATSPANAVMERVNTNINMQIPNFFILISPFTKKLL
jgi:hypothetical protein